MRLMPVQPEGKIGVDPDFDSVYLRVLTQQFQGMFVRFRVRIRMNGFESRLKSGFAEQRTSIESHGFALSLLTAGMMRAYAATRFDMDQRQIEWRLTVGKCPRADTTGAQCRL
jgi:hypothetical protein